MVAEVSIRDLRNHGGEVVKRVLAGESLVVTRSGDPVAELRPVRGPGVEARTLLQRWKHLPPVDPDRLRADIDDLLDARL
jgi:prevent-host-death family protein